MNDWVAQLNASPAQVQACAEGEVAFRQAGLGRRLSHVLLHGIGSASGSWGPLFNQWPGVAGLALAWDAPGYGRSTALTPDAPDAADYAKRMWAWVDAWCGERGTPASPEGLVLVGHSLGALVAAAAALQRPMAVSRLVLLSPALGYARASAVQRAAKLQQRVTALADGPAVMAQRRSAAMVSAQASDAERELVRELMSQVNPSGYLQAAQLLVGGDLLADLEVLKRSHSGRITVASGEADTITPPAGCDQAASATGASRVSLGPVGHVCAVEAPARVAGVLSHASQVEAAHD